MADIASDTKISLLYELYDSVPATFATLLTAIKAKALQWNAAVSGGGIIASTSGNGHSTTFATEGRITAADLVEFGGELRREYEASKAALISAGTPAPTDEQILAEMVHRFEPCTEFTKDYSMARVQP